MKLFKTAYKVVRKNSNEIYKAFGFKHLSDATQYYVHPNNESFTGTTTLCQSIGEAISLFGGLLQSFDNDTGIGDFYVSEKGKEIFFEISIPEDYKENSVVEACIESYKVLKKGKQISLCAYDCNGKVLKSSMEHLSTVYKLLPIFCAVLAETMEYDSDLKAMLFEYVENPAADLFVNIHEDFYQIYKYDEFDLEYRDIGDHKPTGMRAFSEEYRVLKKNQKELKHKVNKKIQPFMPESFLPEYERYIPRLGDEFILPKEMNSLCNAMALGDVRTVLFHGPAGTGKTMTCKLMAQAMGLPLMETINCTENLDEFVLGKFIPEGEKIVFKESYVTKAIRFGGAVVFEEINFARPQYLAFLNSLLDDNGFVRLDNGEVIKRHEHFRFFATMNFGYLGTKELNQSLYNRFNSIVEISAMSDEAIRRMLIIRVPECETVVDKLIGVYHKVKKKIEAEELDVVISPRNLENWARMAKYDGYIRAAEKTLIPIAKCERILEGTLRGIIQIYKWQ